MDSLKRIYGIVLPKQTLPIAIKAVSYHHALVLYLENLPNISQIKGKKFEVYEWLKPFNSRKFIEITDEYFFAIEMCHLTDASKRAYLENRIF